MKKIALVAAALIATAAAAMPAVAGPIITFDTLPNSSVVPDGTSMSDQYAEWGVTFSGSTPTYTGLPTATNYSGGPYGPNYFGNYLANFSAPPVWNLSLLQPRYSTVTMLFANPVSDVSFSLNTFYTQGYATFKAYDASGILLQNITLSANGGWEAKSLSASGISRIDMGSAFINGTTIAIFGIDQLTFTIDPIVAPVPEPASWAMMIGGFGLVGGAMRRRKVRTTVSFA